MSVVIKEVFVCVRCGSPYVEHVEHHKYVRIEGFDHLGEFIIDQESIDDYEYCMSGAVVQVQHCCGLWY